MRTDKAAEDAIARIIAKGDVTTADWQALGLPFEGWLRYAQVDKGTRKTFHGALVAQWRRDRAKATQQETRQ